MNEFRFHTAAANDLLDEEDGGYNEDMAEITRPELDAKLDAIEARAEARVSRIENKIDIAITAIKDASADLKSETRSNRNWMAGVIVSVVLGAAATIVGVYGANASIVQSVIAAFQAGQSSPQQQPLNQQQFKK